MSCNNCFNNCTDIKSDKCIRYTGADITTLGIQNGDTLLSVEQQIISHLLGVMDGSEISFDMGVVCDLIADYLPDEENITLAKIVPALISALCDVNSRLESIEQALTVLNAAYSTDCLQGALTDTHDVLQATVDKVCEVDEALIDFKTSVRITYVKNSDLNTLIQTYLDRINY